MRGRLERGRRPKWCGRSATNVEAKKKGRMEKFEGITGRGRQKRLGGQNKPVP